MMNIESYDSGLLHSNMYVITENDHAIVIDPCKNTEPGKDKKIDWILLTHEHYDHISGVNVWKTKTGGHVLCSRSCAERLGDPRKTLTRLFPEFCRLQTWFEMESFPQVDIAYTCEADQTFEGDMVFQWQGHEVKLMEAPGHSPGSILILMDQRYLFSGDTIFEDRPVTLRFPGGSIRQWKERGEPTVELLPDGLRIYPGHFDSFILNGQQKRKEE